MSDAESEYLEILDSVLQQHSGIVGKTGSGKTVTAKSRVEYLLTKKRRVCAIDPTGAWWGLRSSADGKSDGFEIVIFGHEDGDRYDVPINEHSGAKLAELIAKENLPAIIDVSDFPSEAAIKRFMTAFLDTLFRKNKRALHLVIDEADMFAPQSPMPDSKKLLNVMNNLVRRGRKKGLRVTMVTQRPAVLNKNVLSQVSSLTIMQLTIPHDRRAVEDWIKYQTGEGEGKNVLASLSKLPVGTGWLWAPEEDFLKKIKFPMITTFDSSRTPDDDEEIPEPTSFASVDLSGLNEVLAEEAPAKPVKGKIAKTPVVDVERIRAAAFAEGHSEGHQTGWQDATNAANKAIAEWAKTPLVLIPPKVARPTPRTTPAVSKANGRDPAPVTKSLPLDTSGERKLGPERRPLMTLVRHYPAKFTETEWRTLTGMRSKSGTWTKYKGLLNQAGYITKEDGRFMATSAGVTAIGGSVERPQTSQETIEMWRAAIGPARKFLDILTECYPVTMNKDDLVEATGMSLKSGTVTKYFGQLNGNNLIEKIDGSYRASPSLFMTPGESQ